MDPKLQDSQTPDTKPQSNPQFTSITLSLPKIPQTLKIPTQIASSFNLFISKTPVSVGKPSLKPTLKIPTQITSSFNLSISSTPVSVTKSSLKPTRKIPTQIASISNLSISSTPVSVTKSSLKSTFSANPLQDPLFLTPRRHSDPSNAAGLRRVSVVLFRTDLRVQDNESLTLANNESVSVLPVYCFDPNGFDKLDKSCNKVSFLIESVSDLRKNLQAKGSDLVVRVGKPESVLVELAKRVGAEAVYMQMGVGKDEVM